MHHYHEVKSNNPATSFAVEIQTDLFLRYFILFIFYTAKLIINKIIRDTAAAANPKKGGTKLDPCIVKL